MYNLWIKFLHTAISDHNPNLMFLRKPGNLISFCTIILIWSKPQERNYASHFPSNAARVNRKWMICNGLWVSVTVQPLEVGCDWSGGSKPTAGIKSFMHISSCPRSRWSVLKPLSLYSATNLYWSLIPTGPRVNKSHWSQTLYALKLSLPSVNK